jgi:hypothetical protein
VTYQQERARGLGERHKVARSTRHSALSTHRRHLADEGNGEDGGNTEGVTEVTHVGVGILPGTGPVGSDLYICERSAL